MGRVGLSFNRETQRLYVSDISDLNDFGKALGYRLNDEIISINGIEITPLKIESYFKNFQDSSRAGEDFIVKVLRKEGSGEGKITELKGVMVKSPIVKFNVLEFSDTANPEQLTLRNYWLKPNGIQAK